MTDYDSNDMQHEILREENIRLREALRSERRLITIKIAENHALVDRLKWCNVNGGQAYVLRGVDHGGIWRLLEESRRKADEDWKRREGQ